jgi:lipid II:glycine glycyltransferase (peptidoglycan interpeptide bridge formation enzyme)
LKIAAADLSVCEKSDSFLQSDIWGRFKSLFDWKALAFVVSWGCQERPLLALWRPLFPGVSFVYIPWGPELPDSFPENEIAPALAELARELKKILPSNTAFIRFDPPWFSESEIPALPAPFIRAVDVQTPNTVIIDLKKSEEEILASMKKKWKYNVGLAEKKGVIVTENRPDGMEIFYDLLRETSRRDGIAIHSPDYYKKLFEIAPGNMTLYTASFNGESLAAIVVLRRGGKAVYLYGASSDKNRNLMAAYALQWRAVRDAKASGCGEYDLFGIPPDDNPDHPMAGLYRFKTGFGGKIIHRPGSYDYPLKPAAYRIFNAVELLRKKIRDKRKKKPLESAEKDRHS